MLNEYHFVNLYFDDDSLPYTQCFICGKAEHMAELLRLVRKAENGHDTVEIPVGNSNNLTVDVEDFGNQLEDSHSCVDAGTFFDLKNLFGDYLTLDDDDPELYIWYGEGEELAKLDFWRELAE